MRRRRRWLHNCHDALVATVLLLTGCGAPERVSLHDKMRMGDFDLQANSVEVNSREHQGVPLEVKVVFSLDGGNRFDRLGFTESVTRAGGITFRTSSGWTDRVVLLGVYEDMRTVYLVANPPANSGSYEIEIGNPYGEPSSYILNLGR